jgi:hypothetical protein
VLIAVDRVRYLALKGLPLRLSHARFVINGAIIWCRAALHSAVYVRVAGEYLLEVEVGGPVLTVMVLASNGDDAQLTG